MFLGLAVLLAIVLVALLLYLVLFLGPDGLVKSGGDVTAGIRPILVIDGPGTGGNPRFSRPLGAAFGPDGRIYVADTGNDRVCIFDATGGFVSEFGGKGIAKPLPGAKATWDPGEMNFPAGIDVDENGEVYVADFRNDQVQVFDADGGFLRRFPDPLSRVGKGSSGQDGLGIAATDVAVHDGRVYITDQFQVFVFTTQGEYVTQFGRPGTMPGDLDRPNGVAVARDGTLLVADSNNNRVQAFTPDLEPLWTTGSPVSDLNSESDNEFGLPRGITVNDRGEVLVVDSFEFEIVRMNLQGDIESRHGELGTAPGQFNFPNSVDNLGRRLLVADKENDRVQVLELVIR